jgi:hypothetical protein
MLPDRQASAKRESSARAWRRAPSAAESSGLDKQISWVAIGHPSVPSRSNSLTSLASFSHQLRRPRRAKCQEQRIAQVTGVNLRLVETNDGKLVEPMVLGDNETPGKTTDKSIVVVNDEADITGIGGKVKDSNGFDGFSWLEERI